MAGLARVCVSQELFRQKGLRNSNLANTRVFREETAECACQGLRDIFAFTGPVPHLMVFDNATGVGRRIRSTVMETEFFSRFRVHYGLGARSCDPAAGHGKGSAERKVAFHRKNLLVPMPAVGDIKACNAGFLTRCLELECREHYRKRVPIPEPLAEDMLHSLPLPSRPFDVMRLEHVKTDG